MIVFFCFSLVFFWRNVNCPEHFTNWKKISDEEKCIGKTAAFHQFRSSAIKILMKWWSDLFSISIIFTSFWKKRNDFQLIHISFSRLLRIPRTKWLLQTISVFTFSFGIGSGYILRRRPRIFQLNVEHMMIQTNYFIKRLNQKWKQLEIASIVQRSRMY